jgi:hypothetical protein
MAWGPQYEDIGPSWGDRLMVAAKTITDIQDRKKRDAQQALENERQAKIDELNAATTKQEQEKNALGINAEKKTLADQEAFDTYRKNKLGYGKLGAQANQGLKVPDNWMDENLTDPALRDSVGVGKEPIPVEQPSEKPNATEDFQQTLNEAPGVGVDKYLAGQKDLADKQITTESATALKSATNAQRDEELQRQKDRDKSDAELKRLEIESRSKNNKNGYGIYSDLSDEERQALSNAIDNGLDPYKVNSRTGKLYAQQELLKPGRKWNELAADAAFQRGTGPMNTKALLNAIEPTLTNLESLGMELKNTMLPGVNKVVNFFKEQSGDPKVVAFNNARDDAIAEVERGLMGTGVLSDSKYLRAVKNVNTAQSPEQFSSAINQMKFVIGQRLDALHRGPNYKGGNPKNEEDQPSGASGGSTVIKSKSGKTYTF